MEWLARDLRGILRAHQSDDGRAVTPKDSTAPTPRPEVLSTPPLASLQQALTTAISTGRGVSGIATVLHDELGKPVVIDDGMLTRLAQAGDASLEGVTLPTRRPPGPRIHAAVFRVGDWLLAEACPGDELLGVIGVHDPAQGPAGSAGLVLEQGAMVLSAEMFRLRSVASNELRVWGDLAAELLDSPDIERARSHAAALGYLIDRPHRALVIEMAGPGVLPSMAAMRRAFRSAHVDGSLATARADGIVLFVADDADWDAFGLQLNGVSQPQLRLGVGDRHDPEHLGQSVAEAVLALRLSGGAVARYEDLGITRFLASDTDEARLRSFVHDWLGDLEVYDDAHATDLVHSLGEWLRDQQSVRATAVRLHIHPSTLKYRLRRISDLSGRDLHDPEQRFNLDLAYRIRVILLATREAGLHQAIRPTVVDGASGEVLDDRPAPFGEASSDVEVAVLDGEGVVTWVNDAWREFCRDNGGSLALTGVGTSYFDACAGAPCDPQSLLAVSAVRMALQGKLPAPAWLTLACHGPDVSRWFEMSVSSRQDDDGRSCGATVTLTPIAR